MSLRIRILLAVAGVQLVLVTLSTTIIHNTTVRRFEEIETRLSRDHGRILLYTVLEELDNLGATAGDWGDWDETRDFVLGRAPDYPGRNLDPTSLSNLEIDFMAFLNADGRIVHVATADGTGNLPAGLLKHLAGQGKRVTQGKSETAIDCVIAYPEGAALARSHPVTDSERKGPRVGAIVIGRYMGENWRNELSTRIQHPLDVVLNSKASDYEDFASVENRLVQNGSIAVQALSREAQAVWVRLPCKCPGTCDSALVRLQVPRDISAYGRVTSRVVVWNLVMIGAALLILLWLLLDYVLLRPLRALVSRIGQVERSADFSQRVAQDGGGELGVLARGINHMLQALEESNSDLRRNEKRLRAILDTVQTGILIVDCEEKRIREVNPVAARMIGASAEEIVGKKCCEFVDQARDGCCPADDREGLVLDNTERVLIRWDGARIPILKTVVPIRLGERECYLESFVDLRERKQAEEERRELESRLAQAEKMESLYVMAGSIAHNFNNLLQAVLGNHDLLRHELEEESPRRDCLEAADVAARRAAELSALMLTYVGQGGIEVREINLSRLCENMAPVLRGAMPDTAKISIELESDIPDIRGDQGQLRQLIENLMANAAEAVEACDSGEVRLATGTMHCSTAYLRQTFLYEDQPAGNYVFVEVSDSGCGMSHETTARAFDPYFTTKFAGRGLGLAAALGIVRGHHGAITVYSEPYHGTRIKALFPVRADGPETKRRVIEPLWHGPGHILVVDDDVRVRAVGRDLLEQLGFHVLLASNGDKALDILRERAEMPEAGPVLGVVLDLILPGVSGDVVLGRIREVQPDLPVVLASGYRADELADRFRDVGFDGFIQKPFEIEDIRKALSVVLPG